MARVAQGDFAKEVELVLRDGSLRTVELRRNSIDCFFCLAPGVVLGEVDADDFCVWLVCYRF